MLALLGTPSVGAPNVLWIHVEDQHPWYGTYGETMVATPNIDALARAGVVFERAYAAAPVCSPSRSANITGYIRFGPAPTTTARGGYPATGFTSRRACRRYRNCSGGTATRPSTTARTTTTSPTTAARCTRSARARTKPWAWKGASGDGDWRDAPEGVPFFGQIGTLGGKALGRVEAALKARVRRPSTPATVAVPPQYPDLPGLRDAIATHLDTMVDTDNRVGEIVARLKADAFGRTPSWCCSAITVPTCPAARSSAYDEGLKVPLIVAAPGLTDIVPPGTRRGDLVSLMDIAATSLALAGIPVPETMDSRNVFGRPDYRRAYVFLLA